MLIQPNKHWHWIFDNNKGVMTLELGKDMLFVSKLCKKRCVQHAQEDSPFTAEHTQLYYQFLEHLEAFSWSDPIKVQICLNAVASAQFLKPLIFLITKYLFRKIQGCNGVISFFLIV